MRLSALDYGVLLAYLGVIAAVGLRAARRQKTADDYFVASHRIPGWAVAFTLLGTMISSTTFVALPGIAFASGIQLLAFHLAVVPVMVVVARWVVVHYRQRVRLSAYEYLEQRFGREARVYGSLGFMLMRLLDLGFTLVTTAIAVEVVTGWNVRFVATGVGLYTIAYTLLGGVEAVIWTDVAQALILSGGALVIFLLVLLGPAAGPEAMIQFADLGGRLSLGDQAGAGWSAAAPPTTALLVVVGLFHFGRSYISGQNMVQRYLVADSDRAARRAALLGGFACVPLWALFFFIGAMLYSFYEGGLGGHALPDVVRSRPDDILPYFIATELPRGLVGLLLAAILAAAMSAISADLNSVATVATADYFVRARPGSSDRARLWFGRIAVGVGGALATTIALFLAGDRARAVAEKIVILFSILGGGILGLFVLGFVSPRATRTSANLGIAASLLFVAWATITGPLGVQMPVRFEWQPLLIGPLSHVIVFVIGWAAVSRSK